jgi:hypothetical protein
MHSDRPGLAAAVVVHDEDLEALVRFDAPKAVRETTEPVAATREPTPGLNRVTAVLVLDVVAASGCRSGSLLSLVGAATCRHWTQRKKSRNACRS